jgi:hypothetical protein
MNRREFIGVIYGAVVALPAASLLSSRARFGGSAMYFRFPDTLPIQRQGRGLS